jgi:uncharacterized lipoprotein YehR (DUF1307 family)
MKFIRNCIPLTLVLLLAVSLVGCGGNDPASALLYYEKGLELNDSG